jgi:hypothetical protein
MTACERLITPRADQGMLTAGPTCDSGALEMLRGCETLSDSKAWQFESLAWGGY